MSQQRFFKATRPDGTDFYTGSIDYAAALGEPLPELPGGEFPGTGWYHVGVQSTSCVGMSWPCRLFVVEPVGPVEHVGKEKAGVRSLRVVEERPAYEALGPQGEHVAALISRVKRLTPEEVRRLDAVWSSAGYAARGAAWDAAWNAAWDAARGAAEVGRLAAAWDAAWDAAWVAAWVAAWDAAWVAALRAARDAARVVMDRLAAAWDAIRDAARDAAVALLCRDLIGQAPDWDQDMYDLLTGPWRDVIGPIHPEDDQ